MRSEFELINSVSVSLNLTARQVSNVLKLTADDCTVHFIARYRKEMTNNLDEDQIRKIISAYEMEVKLDKAKETAINSITEQGKLTESLKNEILAAESLSKVEDLYAPFKRKKKTKADIAKENGFEPVAIQMRRQDQIQISENLLSKFSREDIISGAIDIISQDIADDSKLKDKVRHNYSQKGILISKRKSSDKIDDKQKIQYHKFEIYDSFSNSITKLKGYQILALNRGEDLGILSVSLEKDDLFYETFSNLISNPNKDMQFMSIAIKDGYKKLFASVENEVRNILTQKAQEEAIQVFQDNLKKLLMLKPHVVKYLLAIDPGFRTGCKICVLENGNPVEFSKIYLDKESESLNILGNLFSKYSFDTIVLGNGTASDETFNLISKNYLEYSEKVVIVNESGASVYSASEIGKDEFPDLDATDRGTISIGRRYIDCLSEIVKIPVLSIGVGMYQHDMNQKELENKLTQTVEDVVNLVGINVNSASPYLLNYISGMNKRLSKKVFDNAPYKSREELQKVLSDKAYEQAIGFLRVPSSNEPLDNTAIHPEQYDVARIVIELTKVGKSANVIFQSKYGELEKLLPGITVDVVNDIINNYNNAGKELREFEGNLKKSKTIKIEDLKEGDILDGVVRNVTSFGAFIDIGLKNDGLVHISQLANKFVKNPLDVVNVGEEVRAKILTIDIDKKRINLSMKDV